MFYVKSIKSRNNKYFKNKMLTFDEQQGRVKME